MRKFSSFTQLPLAALVLLFTTRFDFLIQMAQAAGSVSDSESSRSWGKLVFQSTQDENCPLGFDVYEEAPSSALVKVGYIACKSYRYERESGDPEYSGPTNLPSDLSFLPADLLIYSGKDENEFELIGKLSLPSPYSYSQPTLGIAWASPKSNNNHVNLVDAYGFSLGDGTSNFVAVTKMINPVNSKKFGGPVDSVENSLLQQRKTVSDLSINLNSDTAIIKEDNVKVGYIDSVVVSQSTAKNEKLDTPNKVNRVRRYSDTEDDEDENHRTHRRTRRMMARDVIVNPESTENSLSERLSLNLDSLSDFSADVTENVQRQYEFYLQDFRTFGKAFTFSLMPLCNYFNLVAEYYSSGAVPQFEDAETNDVSYPAEYYDSDSNDYESDFSDNEGFSDAEDDFLENSDSDDEV